MPEIGPSGFGWGAMEQSILYPHRLYTIAARDLVRFVSFRAKRLSPVSVRVLSDSLRSFLRFLQLEDHCRGGLETAVPTLRARHQAKLPEVIDPGKLKAFLASFDRSTPMGRRDYAMALCMCDLGFRIGEVAQLSLEELDWHHSTLTLARTKQRRERRAPDSTKAGPSLSRLSALGASNFELSAGLPAPPNSGGNTTPQRWCPLGHAAGV